jgi:hypothetical protein
VPTVAVSRHRDPRILRSEEIFMQTLAAVTALFGIALVLLGYLGFLVAAFRTSVMWGLAVLLLPIVPIVFLIAYWERAKNSFFLQLWGIAFVVIAVLVLSWRP